MPHPKEISPSPKHHPQNPMNQERNYAIDSIKGLCMLLVVVDHCGIPLWPAIDCIEVPAFFIASGFLYRAQQGLKNMLWSKTKRLLLPYLIFALLYILLVRPQTPMLFNLYQPANEPLWFLKTLFWVFLLAGCYDKLPSLVGPKLGRYKEYLPGLLSLLSALLVSGARFHGLTIAGLQQALLALPLFYAGYYAKNLPPLSLRIAALFGMIWLLTARNIHFHDSDIGSNFVLFYVSAWAGFSTLYYIFQRLQRCLPLEYIGRNSLAVLGIHLIVIRLLALWISPWYLLLPAALLITLLCVYPLSFLPFIGNGRRNR